LAQKREIPCDMEYFPKRVNQIQSIRYKKFTGD